MPDQYAEQAVSAYMRSSAALKDYIIKNPEASYSNIIDEANKIIAKEEVGFRAKLEVLYTDVFATQQSRLNTPGLNITLDVNDPIKTLLDLMQAGNYAPAIVAAYDDLIVYKNEKIGPYK
jgi:ethanolamine utilization cobalamin adenosyltransferase